jgi:diguanylate cyclase (GGDEF)-like protein
MTAAKSWMARVQGWLAGSAEPEAPPAPPDTLPAPIPADLDRLYAQQAEQVRLLQRQAQLDGLTGLPLRSHFLGLVQQRLDAAAGPGAALLLLRVQQLDGLNQRLGFEATDRLLAALGEVLQTYVDRVPGTCAGRLNGSDFALCLPVAGVARETADSLHAALVAVPALRAARADVAVGGVDAVPPASPGTVLAAADAALAQAEARGASGYSPVVVQAWGGGAEPSAEGGERAWRAQIAAALADGRVQLQEVPVLDAAGHSLHLACRLSVQTLPDGPYQAAEGWFAWARRSRLLPVVDRVCMELALQAIATDGRARAVAASAQSLLSPGFIIDASEMLAASPRAAAMLTVECTDALREAAALPALAAAARAWRAWGVRMGVGPMDELALHLPALKAAGVRHVSLDVRTLPGLAEDAALRSYVQGLAALVHGLGLTVLASAVNDAAEAQILWGLGVDAASGAALLPAPEPALRR